MDVAHCPRTSTETPMKSLDRHLTDRELDRLADFLDRVEGGDLPDLEAMDGFLTALVIGPEFVPPS
jgi:hypothetical protein